MSRYVYKKYLLLAAALFLLFSLPTLLIQKMQSRVVALSAPLMKKGGEKCEEATEKLQLEQENYLLRAEIGKWRALLEQQCILDACQKELQRCASSGEERREEEGAFLLGLQVQAIPAQVIFRQQSSWSGSLWINVGEKTNQRLGRRVVAKSSPVIVGRSVVGAIEYVGKKQSRIRLLTDLGLTPSVRAVRGYAQNAFLAEHIDVILRALNGRRDLPLESEESKRVFNSLKTWKNHCVQSLQGYYGAKGLLQGAITPHWRHLGSCLKGVGFNYDFSDEEGPARDLQADILREGDLLVTTGMDGVFPAGLRVAEVTKIYPLREGSSTYEIEAIPTLGNLNELHTVFVIPPLGFDFEEQQEREI